VLGNEDFATLAQTLPGTAAVVNAVSKDENSIGYGGIAYAAFVRTVKIKKSKDLPAVDPTLENVLNGTYPISRYLYFYTVDKPKGRVLEFIDWVLSPEGQNICKEVGYYPLR
jgi:phosphate transport system substrate-binding protein